MVVANLFNVPGSTDDLNSWATAHKAHHDDINSLVFRLGYGNKQVYPLDPVPTKNTADWVYQHQQWHNEVNAVLGTQGYDLTGFNINDPRELAGWIWLNASEHQQWEAIFQGVRPAPFPPLTLSPINGTPWPAAYNNRYMVVTAGYVNNGSSTCTIGGIAATRLGASTETSAGITVASAIFAAIVPTNNVQSYSVASASNSQLYQLAGVNTILHPTYVAKTSGLTNLISQTYTNFLAGSVIIGTVTTSSSPNANHSYINLTRDIYQTPFTNAAYSSGHINLPGAFASYTPAISLGGGAVTAGGFLLLQPGF